MQVDPNSVWLRDTDKGTAYFPDKDGNFNLKEAGVKYFQDLEVEGPNQTTASVAASARMSGSTLILPQGEVMKCNTIPMMPPILYVQCCKSIIGCETCVNSWYQDEDALTKACPLCGLGRGYNETIILTGFDGFISEMQNLFFRSCSPSENNQ